MAEYLNVEQPFLHKLRQLGWHVIDQGLGVPQEPKKSLRHTFKEVVLIDTFKAAINAINCTKTGNNWLTEKQLDDIVRGTRHGHRAYLRLRPLTDGF